MGEAWPGGRASSFYEPEPSIGGQGLAGKERGRSAPHIHHTMRPCRVVVGDPGGNDLLRLTKINRLWEMLPKFACRRSCGRLRFCKTNPSAAAQHQATDPGAGTRDALLL